MTYTTKDSGTREEFSTGMKRDTQSGKPRFDLLMPLGIPYEDQILTRWAALMSRGAEKYDPRNWEKAETQEELERFKASAMRHFMQWMAGEEDEDHAAAVMYNLMGAEYVKARLTYETTGVIKSSRGQKEYGVGFNLPTMGVGQRG